MANTIFQHKRSGTPANVPSSLELGELAINYADGLIFYKNTTGHIVSISSGGNSFGTINANGTIVVADTPGDVLSLVAGNNVTFSVDAVNDKITINAIGGTSAGYFVGNNGDTGDLTDGLGDIFRVHSNTLTQNVTIISGTNATAGGPLTIANGVTLIIQTGARAAIV